MEDSAKQLKDRTYAKEQAIDRLEQAFGYIERQEREPSQWERVCLTDGFAYIFSGHYRHATIKAMSALADKENQLPDEKLPLDTTYNLTLVQMKEVFKQLRQAPVEIQPKFGNQ